MIDSSCISKDAVLSLRSPPPEAIMSWTRFYIRVPENEPNPLRRIQHADETLQIAGAFITCPPGIGYIQEPDGTFEVRVLAPSCVDVARSMITEHEGLIIEREEMIED